MYSKKYVRKAFLLCIPGLAGFFVFYLIPFVKSLRYAFLSNAFEQRFIWFENFKSVLSNQYFQLALHNTIIFSLLGVAILLVLSFILAYGLATIVQRFEYIKSAFLFPMLLPTICTIFVWRSIFGNDLYFSWMKNGSNLFEALPTYVLFLWKNVGMNVLLFTVAFTQLPDEVYEAAELDGAKGIQRLYSITLPLIRSTTFFVGILSFVNSMKIFKESYLFFGTDYPPDAAYTVQYYMNNHFRKLHYQNLACASTIVALIVGTIIYIVYRCHNRIDEYVEK